MSETTLEIAKMLDMLPPAEQNFAYELMQKLIVAWDPDYTKLTPWEAERLRIASEQIEHGEFVTDEEVDWN